MCKCSVVAKEYLPPYDPTKDPNVPRLFNRAPSLLSNVPGAKRPTKADIRLAARGSEQLDVIPGFSSVAAALDFEHHVGSDPGLELRVLRSVVQREGLLSQVESVVEEIMRPLAFSHDEIDYESLTARVIELLAQVRDRSLEVVECIDQWRAGHALSPPPPFVWQNTNYLLKMCRCDLPLCSWE